MGIRIRFLGMVPNWRSGTRHSKIGCVAYINSKGKREICIQDVPKNGINLYFNEERIWLSTKNNVAEEWSDIYLGFSFIHKLIEIAEDGGKDFEIHRDDYALQSTISMLG